MTRTKPKGMGLVLAVAAIGLVAMSIVVLTGASNAMLFGSRQLYVDACNRNLAASGLAWAEHNAQQLRAQPPLDGKLLSVEGLDISGGSLRVSLGPPRNRQVEVRITTVCTSAGRPVRRDLSYAIAAGP